MVNSIKRLKQVRKQMDDINPDQQIVDEEGKVELPIRVDDEEILSPHCVQSRPVLNSSIAEYMMNHVSAIPQSKDIHIKLFVKKEKADLSDTFKLAIKNYYNDKLVQNERLLTQNMWSVLITLFVSLLLFTLSFFIQDYIHPIFLGVLEVASWVFGWETVDKFFFERTHIRYNQINYYRLMKAKISFQENAK